MRNYPDWIKAYTEYTQFSESPDKFHFWSAVSAIAGALRRRVSFPMGYFEWVPNFYIIFVAPPGIVSKSTTTGIAMKMLGEVPGIKFGPNIATWQALASGFATAREAVEHKATGEVAVMSPMTIHSGELGNLLDPQDRQLVDLLVSLWDGDKSAIRKSTKTMGDETIENPWINILGCTTPSWISGAFPDYVIGGGLTSRCIFVYADAKRKLVAYPGQSITSDIQSMRHKLIEDLTTIAALEGEFIMERAAQAWGEMWYAEHYEKLIKEGPTSRTQGYLARKQTHLHKLAMIVCASRQSELLLTVEHMQTALTLLESMEVDMLKTFSHIGVTDETRAVDTLVHMIRLQGPMPAGQLLGHFYKIMPQEVFNNALAVAQKIGQLRLHGEGNAMMVRLGEVT